MCDAPAKSRFTGWQGWLPVPERPMGGRCGEWVDATYPFSADVPRVQSFAPPTITRVSEMPHKPLNVTRIDTIVHMGTHLDAPRHFFLDGPAMESIPLERLMGCGVVLRIDKPPYGVIEPDDLERARPGIEPGDIVAIDTGWSGKWGTPEWDRHPALALETAHWLLDRGIKLLAVDTPTPDVAIDRRTPYFTWPVHRALLARGVLIAEQLAGLDALGGRRAEFMIAPIPIAGSDGAPARILVRPVLAD